MKELLQKELFSYGEAHITIDAIVDIIVAVFIARLALWLLSKTLKRYATRRQMDAGRSHALWQIVKYLIYFITTLVILKASKIGLSGVLVGSGALLVGVGIGLQQTFNDFFSGIILLFEGSVKVGDKLMVNDIVCSVDRIGIRTTAVTTLDSINIIIPNSMLVTNNVINWSHNRKAVRFSIDVGVSYSSNIDLVEKVLLMSLEGQQGVERIPSPSVKLINYGDSSVDFRLYFFSFEFFSIEKVQSDIRKQIFKNFRKHNIEIPFPQHDLWLKNAGK